MKKVVILLITVLFGTFLNNGLSAQVAYADIEDNIINRGGINTYDASDIANDTVHWFRIKGKDPVTVTVVFTYLSADDATLDIFKGSHKGDSVYYRSIDGLISTDLPITLVKATYSSSYETDSVSSITVIQDYWTEELLGVKLNPSDGTTGTYDILIER